MLAHVMTQLQQRITRLSLSYVMSTELTKCHLWLTAKWRIPVRSCMPSCAFLKDHFQPSDRQQTGQLHARMTTTCNSQCRVKVHFAGQAP